MHPLAEDISILQLGCLLESSALSIVFTASAESHHVNLTTGGVLRPGGGFKALGKQGRDGLTQREQPGRLCVLGGHLLCNFWRLRLKTIIGMTHVLATLQVSVPPHPRCPL